MDTSGYRATTEYNMHLYATGVVLLVATETLFESSHENHLEGNGIVAIFPVKLFHNTNCH